MVLALEINILLLWTACSGEGTNVLGFLGSSSERGYDVSGVSGISVLVLNEEG